MMRYFYDGTALPVTLLIGGCGIFAFLIFTFAISKKVDEIASKTAGN